MSLASTTDTKMTTPSEFDWSSEENKGAARAARTYEQVRVVLCKTTT